MAKKKRNKRRDHYSGIGGQAVLEGIMMKNKDKYSVAVRTPEGDIDVAVEEYESFAPASLNKIPFIRGIFNFIDSLILGVRTLNYSATFYEEEQDTHKKDKIIDRIFKDKTEKVLSVVSVLLSVLIAVGLFMLAPYFISRIFSKYIVSDTALALIEGILRVVIFVLYIILISCMRDIRRVFMYHGAEHKCINCIEKAKPLTVENVRSSSRQHKRCGTSFLFFVVFVSIVLFIFIRVDDPIMRVAIRLLLIPVIAGIAYEIIRLAGKSNNIIVRILSAPGMLLQKLTTREPDDEMIEVGIAAVEAIFDWKQYFIDEFGYDVDAEREAIENAAINAMNTNSMPVKQINRVLEEGNDGIISDEL